MDNNTLTINMPLEDFLEKYACYAVARDAYSSLQGIKDDAAPPQIGKDAPSFVTDYLGKNYAAIEKGLANSGIAELLSNAKRSLKFAEDALLEIMLKSREKDVEVLLEKAQHDEKFREHLLAQAKMIFEPELSEGEGVGEVQSQVISGLKREMHNALADDLKCSDPFSFYLSEPSSGL